LRLSCTTIRLGIAVSSLAALLSHGPSASAETPPDARQDALFAQLYDRPDDLDLMFEYARVSVELNDYEAAIATLERALAYNPRVPAIRLELGALYYRVGAYGAAQAYFGQARASGELTPAQDAQVQEYLDRADDRTARSRLSGEVFAGGIASSNASIGPDDITILSAGTPVTGREVTGDVGAFARGSIRHDYDLGRANADVWRTGAGISTVKFPDEDASDFVSLALRTGPVLSLTPDEYGPKLRPFVEGDYVHFGGDSLYATAGAGAEYVNTVSDRWTVFAEAGLAGRQFFSGLDDEDRVTGRVTVGAAYKPAPDLTLRGRIRLRGDRAARDFNSSLSAGVRVEAIWRYDPGLAIAGRKWVLAGHADAGYAQYDDPDPAIDPDRTRQEKVAALGLKNTFHLQNGVFLRAEGLAHWRDANIPNYDLTVYELRLGVGLDF